MRTLTVPFLLSLLVGCAGPSIAQRSAPVSPAPVPQRVAPALAQPLDDAATRAWLDQEIELAPRVEPPEPIVQVVERVVERPVYVDPPYDPYWHDYRYGGYYPSYGYRRYRCRTSFPINTALGAGIGAIIGHQSGRRSRGAWIGGGLGYLFDVGRCW